MGADDGIPPELGQIASRLRAERPEPSPERLETVRRRLFARAAPRRRTVVAVGACLGMGLALTATGTGLAVSGLATDGLSVRAEYPTVGSSGGGAAGSSSSAGVGAQSVTTPAPEPQPTLGGPPPSSGGKGSASSKGGGSESQSAGAVQVQGTASAGNQPARRLEAESRGGGLPFTGYAAILTMVLGVALTVAGITLRRRLAASEPLHG